MQPVESGSGPNLNLPPPVIQGNEAVPTVASAHPEAGLAGMETTNGSLAPPLNNQTVQSMPISIPFSITDSPQSVAPATTNIVAPATADDGDLIEKEWVAKAKKIIDDNREDPYNQSREISAFKADYMKKRYNKTIKLSE